MQKLQVNYESVNRIIPYERNARVHDAAQIDQIIASINEFGFTNPILIDANNVVVAGHGRLEAAKRLGMDMVPTIKLGHLTDAQRRAYTIADNQIALNSSWDLELLQLELGELQKLDFKIEMMGFDQSKILSLQHDGSEQVVDYDVLGDDELEATNDLREGVKKAIQIEFHINDYEEAFALFKYWREKGEYVGKMLVNFLKEKKNEIENN